MSGFKRVVSIGCCLLIVAASISAAAKPTSFPWPPQPLKSRVRTPAPLEPWKAPGYVLTQVYSGLVSAWGIGLEKLGRYAVVNDYDEGQVLFIGPGNPGHVLNTVSLTEPFAAKMWNTCYVSDISGNLYAIRNGSPVWIWNYGGPDYAISAIGIDHSDGMVYFALSYVGPLDAYNTVIYRFDPKTNHPEMLMAFEDISLGIAVKGKFIYVSLLDDGSIWRLNKEGSSGPPDPFIEGLAGPADIEFDSAGNLWLAQIGFGPTGTIGRIPAGTRKVKVVVGGLDAPLGIGVDLNGRIVFTEASAGRVWALRKR